MSRRVLVLVLALGCVDSTAEKERTSCDRAITLCGYDQGRNACIHDIHQSRDAMGESYGRFLECSIAATTCRAYVDCFVGGLGPEGMKQIDGLRRGMEKLIK